MSMCCVTSKRKIRLLGYLAGAFAATLPGIGEAATVGNPLCPGESVLFNPDNGQDIVVPSGFKVSVFAQELGTSIPVSPKRLDEQLSKISEPA